MAQLTKEDFLIPASAILDSPRMVIPVTPQLDLGLNGGIPEGCWGIVSGPKKGGKTTTLLQFCANAQKPEFGNRKIVWDDVEARLAVKNLTCINGLDTSEEKFQIIRSRKDKMLSAKDHLNYLHEMIMETENCVFIIDSISSFRTDKEFDEGVGAATRGGPSAFMYQFCGISAQAVLLRNHIVIGVMHLMANTSGYGSPFVEKGGNAIQYQSDVHLRIKSSQKWLASANENARPIGQIINWEVVTSALGAPGAVVTSYHRYGYGIDEVTENCLIAQELSLISKAGSWYELRFLESHGVKDKVKFQGEEKLTKALKDNPEWYNLLKKEIKILTGV